MFDIRYWTFIINALAIEWRMSNKEYPVVKQMLLDGAAGCSSILTGILIFDSDRV
jgi:hypothetical protein